jgi:DnaJ-class molecular chaperone
MKCKACDGTGEVVNDVRSESGDTETSVEVCVKCKGSGCAERGEASPHVSEEQYAKNHGITEGAAEQILTANHRQSIADGLAQQAKEELERG